MGRGGDDDVHHSGFFFFFFFSSPTFFFLLSFLHLVSTIASIRVGWGSMNGLGFGSLGV